MLLLGSCWVEWARRLHALVAVPVWRKAGTGRSAGGSASLAIPRVMLGVTTKSLPQPDPPLPSPHHPTTAVRAAHDRCCYPYAWQYPSLSC